MYTEKKGARETDRCHLGGREAVCSQAKSVSILQPRKTASS